MKVEYTIGNHKIGTDTMIINMGSANECPSKALGLCDIADKCYCIKAERQYPNVLKFRNKQAEVWSTLDAFTIAGSIQDRFNRSKGLKYVRFNESGDFYGQDCVEKLKEIARWTPNVHYYTYTHRSDLQFDNLPDNLVINGSGFMIDNNFSHKHKESNDGVCVGDCSICNLCKVKGNKKIYVAMH